MFASWVRKRRCPTAIDTRQHLRGVASLSFKKACAHTALIGR